MAQQPEKRVRLHIVWRAEWDGVFEGWTAKFIRRNKWRCDSIDEFDDLMQDAKVIFSRLRHKYPKVVEPKHFMSLYQISIRNYFHDKSRYVRRKRAAGIVDATYEDASRTVSYFDRRMSDLTNPGYMKALIEEMPDELKLVLSTLTHTTRRRLRIKQPKSKLPLRQRESLNKRLCRTLNLTTTDPVGDLYRYLLGSKPAPKEG